MHREGKGKSVIEAYGFGAEKKNLKKPHLVGEKKKK